jgi:hypothetical protein
MADGVSIAAPSKSALSGPQISDSIIIRQKLNAFIKVLPVRIGGEVVHGD